MEWFRYYNGTACHARWQTIARKVGCSAGVVSFTWIALLEHANTSRPRGSVGSFDAEDTAEFSGFEHTHILAIIDQFRKKGLIVDGMISDPKLYPSKTDRTAAARQQRRRERLKAEKLTNSHGVTDQKLTSHAVTQNVTDIERQSEALALVDSFRQEQSSCSVVKSQSKSKSTRALALSAEQLEQELEQAGVVMGNLVQRALNRGKVKTWAQRQVTGAQLDDAIAIGQAKRAAVGSTQPLNVGFLDTILGDLIAAGPGPARVAAPVGANSVTEDPLTNAIRHADHMLSLGVVDRPTRDRMVEQARAKHAEAAA